MTSVANAHAARAAGAHRHPDPHGMAAMRRRSLAAHAEQSHDGPASRRRSRGRSTPTPRRRPSTTSTSSTTCFYDFPRQQPLADPGDDLPRHRRAAGGARIASGTSAVLVNGVPPGGRGARRRGGDLVHVRVADASTTPGLGRRRAPSARRRPRPPSRARPAQPADVAVLVYSAESPPKQRALVLVDAVDGWVIEHLARTTPTRTGPNWTRRPDVSRSRPAAADSMARATCRSPGVGPQGVEAASAHSSAGQSRTPLATDSASGEAAGWPRSDGPSIWPSCGDCGFGCLRRAGGGRSSGR
jgi:hypothetical protein